MTNTVVNVETGGNTLLVNNDCTCSNILSHLRIKARLNHKEIVDLSDDHGNNMNIRLRSDSRASDVLKTGQTYVLLKGRQTQKDSLEWTPFDDKYLADSRYMKTVNSSLPQLVAETQNTRRSRHRKVAVHQFALSEH